MAAAMHDSIAAVVAFGFYHHILIFNGCYH